MLSGPPGEYGRKAESLKPDEKALFRDSKLKGIGGGALPGVERI